MRIAVFSRYPQDPGHPRGGVESVTVVLVRALAQLDGTEVHVVTLEQKSSAVTEQDGRITIHRLPGSGWPQILDVLAGPGKRRLTRCVMDLGPDVLHVHETYGLGLAGIPVPHVFTVHGFDHANLVANSARWGWIRSKLWKLVERHGLASQRHIISITPYVRQMIEPLTDACIYDIDNPVDDRFFRIVRRPEPGRVLCTGWINERKNTLGSVEAFARVAAGHAGATLAIAGEASQAEYLGRVKQSVDGHGMANRVEFLGHVNHARLVQELSRASVFLLPSRQENAPMAIAEAMAAGIPVIASNRCGMPYMISEGQTGFLIDPESTDWIARRLEELLAAPELAHRMGQAGHCVALDRFHPRAVAEKTLAVYRQVCGSARCRGTELPK